MTKVFAGLFAHFFFELKENANAVDIVVKSAKDVRDLTSAEGYYVKNLLNMFEMHQKVKNCNIVMFDKNMEAWRGSAD